MDEVGKEFEVAPEEAVSPGTNETGEKAEVVIEGEAEISPDTDEIGEKVEVANEAGVGLSTDSGRNSRTYKSIKLLLLIGSLLLTGAALWGVSRGIKQEIPIPASAIASGSGSSYTTALHAPSYWLFESLTDNPDNPTQSETELFENDQSLGPAHNNHDEIRNVGSGRFSHWGSTLYFSTSDNSDPRINGRHYKAVVTATLPIWILAVMAACLLLSLYLNRQMASSLLGPLAGSVIEKIKAQWELPAEPPLLEVTPLWADWGADKRAALVVILPSLISLLLGLTLRALLPTVSPVGDSVTYHMIAAGLTGQNHDPYYGFHWAIGGLAARGFVYPSLVASVYWLLGGPHPGAIAWIQAVVMVPLTTFLIYVAGREAFSRRVGIVASWAFALWFPAVWHTMWLMTETLLNLMMALLVVLLAATIRRKSAKLALLCGVVSGLLSVGHSAYQFLPIALVLAFLAHLCFSGRRHFWLAGFIVIGIFFIQVPYRIAVIAADLPRLGQGAKGYGGGGGWGFYIASRFDTNFIGINDDNHLVDLAAPGQLIEVGRKIDRGEIHVKSHLLKIIRQKLALPDAVNQTLTDSDFYRAGIQNLLERPDKWPIKLENNVIELFVIPDGIRFYAPDPTTATWFRKPWPALSKGLILCTLLGSLFAFWKHRDRLVLFVPAAFQSAVFIVVIVEWRYVIPFWSSMFLLAAAGVVGCLESLSAAWSQWSQRRSLLQRSSS